MWNIILKTNWLGYKTKICIRVKFNESVKYIRKSLNRVSLIYISFMNGVL